MAFTISSDSLANGSTGHVGLHNNIADMLTLLAGGGVTFNVKNTAYGGGATGNGSTDDTAAIQAAVTACSNAGGGIVDFPPGTYLISAALTVATNVMLRGAGSNVTVISQGSTTADCIAGVSLVNFRMEGIWLQGPASGTGNGINLTETGGASNAYIHLTDVTVNTFGGNGIQAEEMIVSRFDRVVSLSNGGKGFYIYGIPSGNAGTSTSFTSCWASGNGTYGWHIQNMVYCAMLACASDGNGIGYMIDGCSGISLDGCGCESTTAKNSLDGTSFKISNSIGVTLTSCWAYLNNAVAYWVTAGSQAAALIGVTENGPGGSATASIKTDTSTMSTIAGINVVTATALTANTYNDLNDGAGNWTVAGTGYMAAINVYGLASFNSGTSTSGTATASTPSLSTTVAAQINTTQDVMLYANITTAATFSLAIGPTSTPATTVVGSHTAAIGLISVRVPAGWYVKSTFTSADVTWTAVTC